MFLIFFVSAKWTWMLSGCCVGKLSLCICIHHAQPFLKTLEHLGSWVSSDMGALLSSGLDVSHRTHTMSNDEKNSPAAFSGSTSTEHPCHAWFSPKLHHWLQVAACTYLVSWAENAIHSISNKHGMGLWQSSCWALGHSSYSVCPVRNLILWAGHHPWFWCTCSWFEVSLC